jgi:hypothetical protein
MPTYLLDMIVESGELYQSCSLIQTPIWVVIRVDGLHQTFSTSQVSPSPRPVWRCPARLVINLLGLEGTHFKATLCTSSASGAPVNVGASQVRLSSLPFGSPSRLSFPLLSPHDYSVQVASLTVRATLSLLPLQQTLQPELPYSIPGSGQAQLASSAQARPPTPGYAPMPHQPRPGYYPPPSIPSPWTGYPGAPEVQQQTARNPIVVLNGSSGGLRRPF